MNSRRYPTAEEVERIMWDLERPMTLRAISRASGVRYDRARYAMISLRYQGLVSRKPRNGSRGALWCRRGRYA